jgi:hypothetical protein
MRTYAAKLPEEFDIFPGRSFLTGQDQIETLHVCHCQGGIVVSGMLDGPHARFKDGSHLFLDLRVGANYQRNANRDGTQLST